MEPRPFLDRSLTESELQRAQRTAQRTLSRLVVPPIRGEETAKRRVGVKENGEPVFYWIRNKDGSVQDGQYPVIGLIPRQSAIGEGGKRIVVPAGRIQTKDGPLKLAVKLNFFPDHPRNTHYAIDNYYNFETMPEGALAEFLRIKGFHLPPHHFVMFPKLGLPGVLTENLAARGQRVEDAHGFDFNKLHNGAQLKAQLVKAIRKMDALQKADHIGIDRHMGLVGGIRLAYLKAFLVQWNPKTNRGRLVLGDINQFMLKGEVKSGRVIKEMDRELDASRRIDALREQDAHNRPDK